MSIPVLLLISLIMSADSFIFGISFGLKGIRLKFTSLVIITITGFSVLLISNCAGEIISQKLYYGEYLGALILIGVGMWLCADTEDSTKSILDHPEKADINKSKTIEPLEAIIMGLILSIDSIAAVLGSAISSESRIILPVFIQLFQIVFIALGIQAGIRGFKNIPERLITIISGFIIVMIGLYRLSTLFS